MVTELKRKPTCNHVQLPVYAHTASSSSVSHSMLLFFASGYWHFWFRDYFRLVARCIVHACARRSYTINSAHIICPKSQWWNGWHSSCLTVYALLTFSRQYRRWESSADSQNSTLDLEPSDQNTNIARVPNFLQSWQTLPWKWNHH